MIESMETRLPLCKELYDTLTQNSNEKPFKLTFAPNQLGIDTDYFISEESRSFEVVYFKGTLLRVFKEAHDFLDKSIPISKYPLNIDLFYCTIGFLLTTPENKTILNVHLELILKFIKDKAVDIEEFLQGNGRLSQRLLTSSNNRLNKSSSLWFFYKILYILNKNATSGCLHFNFIDTIINSGSQHTSNYYCWNASRWFFDVSSIEKKKKLLSEVKTFCFANIGDCSAWSALTYMFCQSSRELTHNIDDYKNLHNQLHINYDDERIPSFYSFDIASFLTELESFITKLRINERPPFLCLLNIMDSFPNNDHVKMFERWGSEVKEFEYKYGKIEIIRNHVKVPDSFSNDAILVTSIVHFGNKKRALDNKI